MKYCSHCGKEIECYETVCPFCGATVPKQASDDDAKSFWWALLCFMFPIVGLILFIVWRKEQPLRASSCGKGALISVIIDVVLSVILWIVLAVAMKSALS